jgi:hypothetical protein
MKNIANGGFSNYPTPSVKSVAFEGAKILSRLPRSVARRADFYPRSHALIAMGTLTRLVVVPSFERASVACRLLNLSIYVLM